MKHSLITVAVLVNSVCCAQKGLSVSIEAGIGPRAKNVIDSSFVNPRHRNTRVIAFTLTADNILNSSGKIVFGFSIRNSIVFNADGWVNFNDLVPGSDLPKTGKMFLAGSYDFYNLKSSLQPNVSFFVSKNKGLSLLVSPELAMYWPVQDMPIRTQMFNPSTGFVYTIYDGEMDFKRGINGYTRVAFKIENTFTILLKTKILGKYKAGLQFNYHLGAKKLEVTHLTFYPEIPQFRAKIHYSQNNNYCSLALRYYFEKSKRKT